MKILFYLVFTAFMFNTSDFYAQETPDSTKTEVKKEKKEKIKPLVPYHRNVIKFNPTPMLIFGQLRNITFSYERLIKNNQSASIQLGVLLFPRLFDDTIVSLLLITDRSRMGANIALDYRYYPGSRNRRPAPDGLYIGGYVSYYGFKFQNKFNILHTEVDKNGTIEGNLNFFNLGVNLGYQFVFWKRFTIDMLLFGPSVSYYARGVTIHGDLDETELENINQDVLDRLKSRFPLLKSIFDDEDLRLSTSRAQLSIGFRYNIQLGFHF